MKLLPRLKIWLDPRRSFAARLLFGLFLAFLIPGTILVFLLEGRVRDLRDSSLEQFGVVRRVQSSLQLQQDTSFRAEWIERRAAAAEEAAWALGSAVGLAWVHGDVSPDAPVTVEVRNRRVPATLSSKPFYVPA